MTNGSNEMLVLKAFRAYLSRKHRQHVVRLWIQEARPLAKGPWFQGNTLRTTSERRMRSKHPTLYAALELNLSLSVDSSRARLFGSAGIGNA